MSQKSMSLRLKSLLTLTIVSAGLWIGILAVGHSIYPNAAGGNIDQGFTAGVR
ncbi:hypothetical protein [Rhizobium sp. 18055]|jgi:hypothetical protein|uniref:hypothetical protein n=1 Tax=Rhizobium sp. 18055 TaxID=2681403 RepID=UPI00135BDA8A|nr:hypothetical protein [Rhizobium sp. 18055]